MSKRRRYNWPQLLADFEQSGLSQVEFCKQRDLNATYFSHKLAKHKASQAPAESAFTRIAVTSVPVSTSELIVEVGQCKIHCPKALPMQSLVSLVKALA